MKLQTLLSVLFYSGLIYGFLSCTGNALSLRARKEALGKLIFQDTVYSLSQCVMVAVITIRH